jgi:flagellar motility protein MotE (MotC chaperone)
MVHFSIKALALSAVFAAAAPQLSAQDTPPAMPTPPAEVRAGSDSSKASGSDSTLSRAARMSAEIAAAISEYTKDMAALEKQIRDKDISKEDAERRRKELSDRLEARLEAIEEMAEAWADNLEESIENLELNLGDNLKLNIEPSKPKKTFKKKIDGVVVLIGTNQLIGSPIGSSSSGTYEGDWNPTGSRPSTIGVYDVEQRRLGRTPLWYRAGWGPTFYTYDFGQNILEFDASTSGSYGLVPSTVNLRQSTLTMTYFELQNSLVINPSRLGKGLSLSAGLNLGFRLGGSRQLVYRAEGVGRVTENMNANFYGQPLIFGWQVELGYRSYTVGARYNVTPPFTKLPTNVSTGNSSNFYNASAFASVRLF